MIQSIEFSQSNIIKSILQLHVPSNKIDIDPCYSVGNFYKKTGIEQPLYCSDIISNYEYVKEHSADKLPHENNSAMCIMFDPPFLATTGPSLKTKGNSNKINKRFGVFKSETELHLFYKNSLTEFYRVLDANGILIFKCQDKVSSGTQYISHNFIINEAEKIGFYTVDLFILLVKNRIVADWQKKNQQHARKFHSYFIVLKKCNKKVTYLKTQ